jgi:hypothetical protein
MRKLYSKIYLIEQKIYPNHQDGFLRRNISKFPEEIKKRAYQAIVRPNVEYASSAWDPYQANQIKKIEMVQRRSTCPWVILPGCPVLLFYIIWDVYRYLMMKSFVKTNITFKFFVCFPMLVILNILVLVCW